MNIQEIRDRLDTWKANDFYSHSKSYRERQSNMVPGEFFYILSWRLNLSLYNIADPIVQTKHFHTQTLSPNPLSENPIVDLYRLNSLLPAFDNEFMQKVDDAYTKRLEELNPPGFF